MSRPRSLSLAWVLMSEFAGGYWAHFRGRQLGGYARHRNAFRHGGWQGLVDEVGYPIPWAVLVSKHNPADIARHKWTFPDYLHETSHETTESSHLTHETRVTHI